MSSPETLPPEPVYLEEKMYIVSFNTINMKSLLI